MSVFSDILRFYYDNIDVNPIGKSNVFKITVKSQNPKTSALVANEIVNAFKEYVASTRDDIINLSKEQVDKQVSALQNKINHDRSILAKKKIEYNFDKVSEVKRQIGNLEWRLKEILRTRDKLYASGLASINKTMKEDRLKEVIQYDNTIEELNEEINDKYAEKNSLISSNQIDEIDEIEKAISTNQKLLSKILENREVSQLAIVTTSNQVRTLDSALVPIEPIKTKGLKNLFFALILGLGTSFGIAYMIELMDTSFKNVNDVENFLKLPILATIPDISALSFQKNPKSTAIESFRTLRTNIKFLGKDMKTFVFSSPTPESGKSLISSNLGLLMNSSDDKVVVIDTDLRKSNIHHLFKIERSPGLSDILEGKVSLKDGMRKLKENLYVITAGSTCKNPQKMLESKEMDDLLEELKKQFDYVLIDSVPAILLTDAQIIASKADATILVLNAQITKKDDAAAAKKSFTAHNCNLVGAIFNKVDTYRDKYYYRYKYNKYY